MPRPLISRRAPLLPMLLAGALAFASTAGALVPAAQPARARVYFVRPANQPGNQPGALMALNPDGSVSVVDQPLADPRDVVELADGTALVTDGALGLVVGIGGRFGAGQKVKVVEGLPQPQDLFLSATGALFVTTLGGDGGVAQIDLDRRQATSIATGLGRPVAGAVAPTGSVVIADARVGRVLEVGPGGGAPTTLATGFSDLAGVAVTPDGSVFACDRRAGAVFRIGAPGEAPRRVASVPGPLALQLVPADPVTGASYLGVPSSAGFVAVRPATGATAVIPELSQLGAAFAVPARGRLFDPPAALRADLAGGPTGAASPSAAGPAAAAEEGSGPGLGAVTGVVALCLVGATMVVVARRRRRTGTTRRAAGSPAKAGAQVARAANADPQAHLDALRRAQAAWQRYLELQRKLQELKDRHKALMEGSDVGKQLEAEREMKRLEAESEQARREMTEARGVVGSVPAPELKAAEEAAEKARAEAAKTPSAPPPAVSAPPAPDKPLPPDPDPPRGAVVTPCTHGDERRTTTKETSFVVPAGQPTVKVSPQIERGRLRADSFSSLLEAAGFAAEILEAIDEVLGWASYVGAPAPEAIGKAAEALRAMARGLGAVTGAGEGILSRLPNVWDVSIEIRQEAVTCRCEHLEICRSGSWVDGGTKLLRSSAKSTSWYVSSTAVTLDQVATQLNKAATKMDELVADAGAADAFTC